METEKTFSGLKYEEMEAEWMWPLIMKPVPAYAMRGTGGVGKHVGHGGQNP
jgi:hypothetical protein